MNYTYANTNIVYTRPQKYFRIESFSDISLRNHYR